MSKKLYLAMDVGGTNVNAGLLNSAGQILERRHFPTISSRSPEQIIQSMVENLEDLLSHTPKGSQVQALAVGLPGWIDQARGLLVKAPNMPGWVNVPLGEILQQKLKLPVYIENDTNLYAMGEWLYGAAKGFKNILVITLGTGVGGGLILENRLWYGSFDTSVEIGHMPVKLDGAICGCGRQGCLETIASASGMCRLGREWIAAGNNTLYEGKPDELNTKIMAQLYPLGDAMSEEVFRQAGEALGFAIANVGNLLGMEAVIIGGGVAKAFDILLPYCMDIIAERLIVAEPTEIVIRQSSLADDAPLAGAPALLKQHGF